MSRDTPALRAQILEEATVWFVEANEPGFDASARAKLDGWLRRSPEHVQAYLEVAALWEEGDALARSRTLAAEALIDHAVKADNVVPLAVAQSTVGRKAADPVVGREVQRRRVAVAASALVATVLALAVWQHSIRDVYSTATGEQRSIILSDGSSVELNARSKLRIRYTEGRRDVHLLAGQALFRVAKDPARPFVVTSNGTLVRAVGTQFDVYLKSARTTVTVVEGRVAISGVPAASGAAQSADGALTLDAGEQAIIGRELALRPSPVDTAAATAWTRQQIVFQSSTLRDVIDEFNRYNSRQLEIADPQLESVRISGAFSSADTRSLLQFLESLPGIEVAEAGGKARISRRAAAE